MTHSPEVDHLLKAVDAVKEGLLPEKKNEPTPEPDLEPEPEPNAKVYTGE